jgi:hypothetical protein
VLDDQRTHLRARALGVRVPESEHGPDGVDGPVLCRGLEACPLAGARIADLEHRPDDRRILLAARQRCDDALARHEDQMLAAVALFEHELAAGDPLVVAVGDAEQTEKQGCGETVRHAVILREAARAALGA